MFGFISAFGQNTEPNQGEQLPPILEAVAQQYQAVGFSEEEAYAHLSADYVLTLDAMHHTKADLAKIIVEKRLVVGVPYYLRLDRPSGLHLFGDVTSSEHREYALLAGGRGVQDHEPKRLDPRTQLPGHYLYDHRISSTRNLEFDDTLQLPPVWDTMTLAQQSVEYANQHQVAVPVVVLTSLPRAVAEKDVVQRVDAAKEKWTIGQNVLLKNGLRTEDLMAPENIVLVPRDAVEYVRRYSCVRKADLQVFPLEDFCGATMDELQTQHEQWRHRNSTYRPPEVASDADIVAWRQVRQFTAALSSLLPHTDERFIDYYPLEYELAKLNKARTPEGAVAAITVPGLEDRQAPNFTDVIRVLWGRMEELVDRISVRGMSLQDVWERTSNDIEVRGLLEPWAERIQQARFPTAALERAPVSVSLIDGWPSHGNEGQGVTDRALEPGALPPVVGTLSKENLIAADTAGIFVQCAVSSSTNPRTELLRMIARGPTGKTETLTLERTIQSDGTSTGYDLASASIANTDSTDWIVSRPLVALPESWVKAHTPYSLRQQERSIGRVGMRNVVGLLGIPDARL